MEKFKNLDYDYVLWLCEIILEEIFKLNYAPKYSFEFDNGRTYYVSFGQRSCRFIYVPRLRQEFIHLQRVLRDLPLQDPYSEEAAMTMSEDDLKKGCKRLMRLIRLCHNMNRAQKIVIMDGEIADDEIPMFTLRFDQVDHSIIGIPLKIEELEVLYRVWEKLDPSKKN